MSQPQVVPVVVKVGGSLFSQPGFAQRLNRWLGEQPPAHYLLFSGGGELVDVLRRWHALHGWKQRDSHWAAVRALGANAWMLHALVPGSLWLSWPEEFYTWAGERAKVGGVRVGVCDPWNWVHRTNWGCSVPDLPQSWNTTSDSLAAWVAAKLEAQAVVLLKSAPVPPSLAQATREGYVDPVLEKFWNQLSRRPRLLAVHLTDKPQAVEW